MPPDRCGRLPLCHVDHPPRRADLNITVGNLIVTSGNAGGQCYAADGTFRPDDYPCEREELALLRRREMIAAAATYGVPRARVWRGGFDDGMLLSYHESAVRERISGYIRAFRQSRAERRRMPQLSSACNQTGLGMSGHSSQQRLHWQTGHRHKCRVRRRLHRSIVRCFVQTCTSRSYRFL